MGKRYGKFVFGSISTFKISDIYFPHFLFTSLATICLIDFFKSSVSKYPNKVKKYLQSTYPLERFGQPKEIASIVLYLASEQSSFVTGSLINVDGGTL